MSEKEQIKAVDKLVGVIRQFNNVPILFSNTLMVHLFYSRAQYALKELFKAKNLKVDIFLNSDLPKKIVVWHQAFRLTVLPPDRVVSLFIESVHNGTITERLMSVGAERFVNIPYDLIKQIDDRVGKWLIFQDEPPLFSPQKLVRAFTD